jgi:hypothetical protein
LIEGLSLLSIVIGREGGKVLRHLAEPTPIQHRILKLLSVQSGRLRTFKRRCGM